MSSPLRAVFIYSDETACWQISILNVLYWLLTVWWIFTWQSFYYCCSQPRVAHRYECSHRSTFIFARKNNQVFLFKAILWDPFLLKLFFCIHILIFTGICLLYCITDILLFCMYSQTELDHLTSFWLNSFGAFLNQATFLFLCASKLGAVPQSPALGPEYVLPLLPPSLSINLSAPLYWNCILSVLVSNPCPQRSDPGWVPTCPASPQLVSC